MAKASRYSNGRLKNRRLEERGEWRLKSTGIVRKVDELGRIVLPIELRRSLSIREREELEIFVDGEALVLRKHRRRCTFCEEDNDLMTFRGKPICRRCRKELASTA